MEERNAKALRCKDAGKKEEERNAKTQRCKDARKKEEGRRKKKRMQRLRRCIV